MASPSLTYSLTNGTTADASQVMQNYNDLLNGITDGTKDLSFSQCTLAGALVANGNCTLGNATGDDITITGSLASSIPVKTTATYDVGSSTLGLQSIYFGRNSQTVRIIGSSSMSATWTLTLPVTAGTADYVLTTNGSGTSSWSQIVNAGVSATAAIAYSKLNLATSIVNADVSATAAIAGSKISPDFGSQAITTTGSATFGGTMTRGAGGTVWRHLNASTSSNVGSGSTGDFDTSLLFGTGLLVAHNTTGGLVGLYLKHGTTLTTIHALAGYTLTVVDGAQTGSAVRLTNTDATSRDLRVSYLVAASA